MVFISNLIFLLGLHLLCDYPLQGDFLSRAKNHLSPIAGVPWKVALVSHAGIHAFAVFFVTGSVILMLVELVTHALIDYYKCANKISYSTDQMLHIALKILYAAIIAAGIVIL